MKNRKTSLGSVTFQTNTAPPAPADDTYSCNRGKNYLEPINRFGYRPNNLSRINESNGKSLKKSASPIFGTSSLVCKDSRNTESLNHNRCEISHRSRSEGPRETFFKQIIQS